MSMSTHVVGFRPPNEKWKKMKAVWDACAAANISVPEEVEGFFGHTSPDKAGVEVALEKTPCCRPWSSDNRAGFEIDVTKLPKDVTVIRFFNDY